MRFVARTLVVIVVFAIGVWLWWLYGTGLSEQTSYRLAVDYARQYTAQNGIDLNQYDAPTGISLPGSRLYEFSWTPKGGKGAPLTIVVDSQTVDVSVVESPTWTRRDHQRQ